MEFWWPRLLFCLSFSFDINGSDWILLSVQATYCQNNNQKLVTNKFCLCLHHIKGLVYWTRCSIHKRYLILTLNPWYPKWVIIREKYFDKHGETSYSYLLWLHYSCNHFVRFCFQTFACHYTQKLNMQYCGTIFE